MFFYNKKRPEQAGAPSKKEYTMKEATDRQKDLIETLVMKRHGNDIQAAILDLKPSSNPARFTTVRQALRGMSIGRASEVIDALKNDQPIPIA